MNNACRVIEMSGCYLYSSLMNTKKHNRIQEESVGENYMGIDLIPLTFYLLLE